MTFIPNLPSTHQVLKGISLGQANLEKVEFSYPQRLDVPGVSLDIKPGQSVALVGPTGELLDDDIKTKFNEDSKSVSGRIIRPL